MADEFPLPEAQGEVRAVSGSEPAIADDPGGGCNLYNTMGFTGCITKDGEAGRLEALKALGMVDTPREGVFDAITDMMKQQFQTPASHLVLIDPSRCWFKSWTGSWCDFEEDHGDGPSVQCPREEGWCNYILVPTTAELLIIDDATKDARVSLNTFVVGPPYFRFYAGAPLVGSQGHRYGTLCVVDFVPRTFTADNYALLTNFAALAVEELEHNRGLVNTIQATMANDVVNNRHLDLSLKAAHDGILMLDMRESSWPITFANPAFEMTSGLATDTLVGGNFWDHFACGSKTRLEIGLFIGVGDTFDMQVKCGSTNRFLSLRFLPATSDRLAPSKATGLPAWAPFEVSKLSKKKSGEFKSSNSIIDDVKCFWFAVITATADTAWSERSTSSLKMSFDEGSESSATMKSQCECSSSGFINRYCEYHLPAELNVQGLGPLLGSGSYGKVYRAMHEEQVPCAVKVIDCRQRNDAAIEAQLREVQLSRSLDHPNVVRVLSYATSTDMAGGKQLDILWMVLEMCDLGTLSRGAEMGWLRQERKLTSPPDMAVVLPTLHDIASTMAYVHNRGIIHADLTGRNVLLSSSESRPCGFIAKVCDFGLSRYTHGHSLSTDVLGTITHMPPELLKLKDPVLASEGDVWAFGIIAWEALHGKCAYHGKHPPQIVVAVMRKKLLPWAVEAPEDVISLMKTCLKFEHTERPSFMSLAEDIQSLMSQSLPG